MIQSLCHFVLYIHGSQEDDPWFKVLYNLGIPLDLLYIFFDRCRCHYSEGPVFVVSVEQKELRIRQTLLLVHMDCLLAPDLSVNDEIIMEDDPSSQKCGLPCHIHFIDLLLTGCLLRAEARFSGLIFCRLSGAVCLFDIPLPLIHPVGPVHLSVSGDTADTKIHIKAIEQAIEGASVKAMNTELHHTFTATPEPQLSTAHVASAPVETADARSVKIEVIDTDHASLWTNGKVSPELVCVDVVVNGDARRSIELSNVVGRMGSQMQKVGTVDISVRLRIGM